MFWTVEKLHARIHELEPFRSRNEMVSVGFMQHFFVFYVIFHLFRQTFHIERVRLFVYSYGRKGERFQ